MLANGAVRPSPTNLRITTRRETRPDFAAEGSWQNSRSFIRSDPGSQATIRQTGAPGCEPHYTLLHGYANPLKKLDTSESVNPHKCLILLDSCQIHATRCREKFKRLVH